MTTPANDEAALAAAQRLREAHAKTTQGEWFINPHDKSQVKDIALFSGGGLPGWHFNDKQSEPDAAFTALAHNELPALLEDYAALSDREARLRAFVERVSAYNPDDYYEDRLSGIVKGLANAAKTLLSAIGGELGGGESEVSDG